PQPGDSLVVLGVSCDQQCIVGQRNARNEQVGPAHLLEVLLLAQLPEVTDRMVIDATTRKSASIASVWRNRSIAFRSSSSSSAFSRLSALPRRISLRVMTATANSSSPAASILRWTFALP